MPHAPLTALSPLDGRYAEKLDILRPYLSEYALIHHRVFVEVSWLASLGRAGFPELPPFSAEFDTALNALVANFSEDDALWIKAKERETNHDVKAIEYWMKDRLTHLDGVGEEAQKTLEFVHFACTSEDINNLAYGVMMNAAREKVMWPAIDDILAKLTELAHAHADLPMLARTHGQPATPTTLGKEFANFASRVKRALARFAEIDMMGKLNGATGNYNAHMVAYPDHDWEAFNREVVENMGLAFNEHTTQIEPHDSLADLFDALARVNTILLGLCRDIWGYVSIGYFKQKLKDGEVGSSTMPHKVNPIDFENAEGNLGLANAMLRHLSDKLPVSRWQRDLTDSTVLRNIGVAFGHSLLAYESCLKGLNKLEVDSAAVTSDLEDSWEVLAEAVQTVMRRYGLPNPYEELKKLTRGQRISKDSLREFIAILELPVPAKRQLLTLKPSAYTGKAAELAKRV